MMPQSLLPVRMKCAAQWMKILLFIFLSCCAVFHLAAGPALAQAVQEYEIKAAFIYNFAKFVEWPPEDAGITGPITIAVVGKDPFGDALELLKEKNEGTVETYLSSYRMDSESGILTPISMRAIFDLKPYELGCDYPALKMTTKDTVSYADMTARYVYSLSDLSLIRTEPNGDWFKRDWPIYVNAKQRHRISMALARRSYRLLPMFCALGNLLLMTCEPRPYYQNREQTSLACYDKEMDRILWIYTFDRLLFPFLYDVTDISVVPHGILVTVTSMCDGDAGRLA